MINKDDIKYSIVLCYNHELNEDEYKDIGNKIDELIINGKKVIVFAIKSIYEEMQEFKYKYEDYKDFNPFQIYEIKDIPNNINLSYIEFNENKLMKNVVTVDGQDMLKIKNISQFSNSFNFEQYEVEHYDKNVNIKIKAGAGSGKTTTMVNRIMFLIHSNKDLNLKNIHMITFTNKAKDEMKEKIKENILQRWNVTKNIEYIKYLEQLGNMNISTIDSYFKNIANEIGISIGHHNNLKMRSFTKEKKDIIKAALNEVKEASDILSIINLDDLEKIIKSFWDKFYTVGITDNEIKCLDWAEGVTREEKDINNVLKQVFDIITEEFSKLMKEEKSIELRNILLNIERAIDENIYIDSELLKQKVNYPEYIFVDEFQDTSKLQVKVIAWICDMLDSKIFVVGDQKQAIYRFRGASEKAFEQLEEYLKSYNKSIIEFELKINYRTQSSTLEQIQDKILPWVNNYKFDEKYKLTAGNIASKGIMNIIEIEANPKQTDENKIRQELNKKNRKHIIDEIYKNIPIKGEYKNKSEIIKLKEVIENEIIGMYILKNNTILKEEKYKNIYYKSINIYKTNILQFIYVIYSFKSEFRKKYLKNTPYIKEIKEQYELYIKEIKELDLKEIEEEDIIYMVESIADKIEEYEEDINIRLDIVKFLYHSNNNGIVVLARDNKQVEQIKSICEGNHIPCSVDIKGNFYGSRAIRDYYILVRSFLYNDIKHKISLIDTPYISINDIDIIQITKSSYNIEENKVEQILKINQYDIYRNKLRMYNFLDLSDIIIKERQVIHNFYKEVISNIKNSNLSYNDEQIDERAKSEAGRYEKNLSRLIAILRIELGEEASIVDICDYLEIKIRTDRDTEEADIDISKNEVVCMTVHKSKGLQFKNVLIPFTNKPYSRKRNNNILVEFDKNKNIYRVGWNISVRKYNKLKKDYDYDNYKNTEYDELYNKENDLLTKDEINLLYVAFTRAEDNLTIIKPKRTKKDTWGYLLQEDNKK